MTSGQVGNAVTGAFSPKALGTRQRQEQTLGALYTSLLHILSQYDLMGIVDWSGDLEEYELEARTILPRLPEARSAAELRHIIYEAFVDCFSIHTAGSESQYQAMAQEIWAAWQQILNTALPG